MSTRYRTGRQSLGSAERLKLAAWLRAQRRPCHLCGGRIDYNAAPRTPRSFSVDEIIPRSKGGPSSVKTNCAPAHYGCNAARGNRPIRRLTPPKVEPRWQSRAW